MSMYNLSPNKFSFSLFFQNNILKRKDFGFIISEKYIRPFNKCYKTVFKIISNIIPDRNEIMDWESFNLFSLTVHILQIYI